MRLQNLFKLLVVMLLALTVSVEAEARSKKNKVYVTVQTEGTRLCKGPLKEYYPFIDIKEGERVQIRDISRYESGWVKVWYAPGVQGLVETGWRGYIPVENLMGDYIEEYKAKTPKYKIAIRCIAAYIVDFRIVFNRRTEDIKDFYGRIFISAKDNLVLAWSIVLICLAMSIMFFRWLRSYDKDYKKPVIHYLLYVLPLISLWGFSCYSDDHGYEYTFTENLLLFMMTMVNSFIAINAGWGVRQCGLQEGKNWDNSNFEIGQVLLFPAWILTTVSFWFTFIYPALEWAEQLPSHVGTFKHFALGLAIWIAGCGLILWVWVYYIVPRAFRTAGNWPLRIMTLVLWWAVVKFGYFCIGVYFNGFVFALAILLGVCGLISVVYYSLGELVEIRCPLCHDCYGMQTAKEELGIKVTKRIGVRGLNASDITPEHSDAVVLDPEEVVQTTIYSREWNTKHTCPTCGTTWSVYHIVEIDSRERVLEQRHTEVYPKP